MKCGTFLFALLLCSAWAAAQAGDQWYLITEPELQNLEKTWKTFEAEKQGWLLQAQTLNKRAANLEAESASLNSQLRNQQERNQKLTLSFNEYEDARLTQLSLKNGEIAGLKESVAAEKLKLQKSRSLNIILGGILALIAVLAAVFLYVKIRFGGLKLPKLFG
jgi:septal ring factor EnvC (AmiA/AmiB activator)